MVPGQEANNNNLGKSFRFLHNNCNVYSLDLPQ